MDVQTVGALVDVWDGFKKSRSAIGRSRSKSLLIEREMDPPSLGANFFQTRTNLERQLGSLQLPLLIYIRMKNGSEMELLIESINKEFLSVQLKRSCAGSYSSQWEHFSRWMIRIKFTWRYEYMYLLNVCLALKASLCYIYVRHGWLICKKSNVGVALGNVAIAWFQ